MKFKILTLMVLVILFTQCKMETKVDMPKKNTEAAVEEVVFELPKVPEGVIHTFAALPYDYDALEPYIDAETMKVHYSKHHVGYYKKFLKAIEGTDLGQKSMQDIFANITSYAKGVRNYAGGYWNHEFFWNTLAPEGNDKPTGALMEAINRDFGSFENYKKAFNEAASTRFGSGWAWLVLKDGKLEICSTANQNNPMMPDVSCQGTPLMAIDVWEHAYYLKYQNKRPDYIGAFWHVINWPEVQKRYEAAMK